MVWLHLQTFQQARDKGRALEGFARGRAGEQLQNNKGTVFFRVKGYIELHMTL